MFPVGVRERQPHLCPEYSDEALEKIRAEELGFVDEGRDIHISSSSPITPQQALLNKYEEDKKSPSFYRRREAKFFTDETSFKDGQGDKTLHWDYRTLEQMTLGGIREDEDDDDVNDHIYRRASSAILQSSSTSPLRSAIKLSQSAGNLLSPGTFKRSA